MTSSAGDSSSVAGQRPRIRITPRRTESWGDLAGGFAVSYGLTPDPWQQLVLDDWLGRDGERWASTSCGLSVPRQNGKNGALEVRELFGAVGLGEKILHTAHEVKTAQKHFRRLKHFFGTKVGDPKAKYPELNAMVVELRNVNGQEAIYLSNGGQIEIVARSKGSARGFTNDVIICDEAQDMSDEDQEALGPATSAAPLGDPQKIYTGTPPGPKVNGEVFTRIRASAVNGDARRSWHEWSAKSDGLDLDDRQVWIDVNPGLITGRLLWSEVEDNRSDYSDEGFARERLGMWEEASTTQVIDADSWLACEDTSSLPKSRFVLGVDVDPDQTRASVALAGIRADGLMHFELDETRNGLGWVPAYIQERCARNPISSVVIDSKSPAAVLVDELKRRKVRVTVTNAGQMADACDGLYAAIMERTARHIGQPQLASSLAAGRKRIMLTDRWGWNRKNAASDITPLVAVTLALWGVGSLKIRSRSNAKPKVVVLR